MVSFGFGSRLSRIGSQLKDFAWRGNQWQYTQPTPPPFTEQRATLNQSFSAAYTVTTETETPTENLFYEYKAWVTWYSHSDPSKGRKTYDVLREISIHFWARDMEGISSDRIRDWLSKACDAALQRNLSQIEGWKAGAARVAGVHSELHYEVLEARTGRTAPDKSEYEASMIDWEYLKENRQVHGGHGRFGK